MSAAAPPATVTLVLELVMRLPDGIDGDRRADDLGDSVSDAVEEIARTRPEFEIAEGSVSVMDFTSQPYGAGS